MTSTDPNPANQVPWHPDGPLPVGLTASAVASAYKAFSKLRAKQVLRTMKRTPKLGEIAADELRRALDQPENRVEVVKSRPPLQAALYFWLRSQQSASEVYSTVIEPAEVLRERAAFLDPMKFAAAVRESRISFAGDPRTIKDPGGRPPDLS